MVTVTTLLQSRVESGVDAEIKPVGVFQGYCYSADGASKALMEAITNMEEQAASVGVRYLFGLRFKRDYQGHPSHDSWWCRCQADGYERIT